MLGLGNSLSTTVAPSGGFELTDIGGLDMWLKYNEGFVSGIENGELIARWEDSSGNDNHAVQEVEDFKPSYFNGSADFNIEGGNRDKLGFTPVENVKGTIFMVIEPDDDASMTLFGYSRSSSVFYRINQSETVEYRIRKGSTNSYDTSDIDTDAEPFVNSSTPMLIIFNQKGDLNLDIHTGGNGNDSIHQHDDYGVDAAGNGTALKIDQIGTQGASSNPFNGRLLELAIYNSPLTAEIILNIKQNIADRTGVNLG